MLVAVTAAGLLLTFSRSALLALAVGLVVLAALRCRPPVLAAGAAVVVVASPSAGRTSSRRSRPTGTWTKTDLVYQHARGAEPGGQLERGGERERVLAARALAEPARRLLTVVHHPQGYGLGNVGQTASRTNTPLKAGESNYTELGVELGLLGALLWTAWGIALLAGLVRAAQDEPWAAAMAAAFAAVLALAVQTDVIGDPWVAYCVWSLGGSLALVGVRGAPAVPGEAAAGPG